MDLQSDSVAPAPHADSGSAMILTLMVMALLSALATTVAVVTINNLQSSVRAQQAGSALNAADAGVAQAMAYLRNSGVRDLRCSPGCSTNPWGSQTNPATVSVLGKAGESYRAWIEPVAPFPANDPGLYRIHSTGSAAGSASRAVTADVGVTTSNVPKGIFARTISGGGNASVARESIFSTGCVYNRSKIQMAPGEIDLAYGIPIAVHSSQIITDSNGTGQYCPTTNKPIHRTGAQNQNQEPCNTSYPYDQDRLGGSLLGTTCAEAETSYPDYYAPLNLDSDAGNEMDGSYIEDDATLFKLFGIASPALTQSQIDQMRTIAQSQGNYWTSAQSTQWSSPDEPNAVMFFDLTQTDPGGTVDLNDITGFSRAANISDTSATCESKSLTIVIEGGNVKLNSNQQLAASVFLTSSAPHGQVFKANGTSSFIGTIYADTVNLTGTADLSMDTCFLANVSPALLDLSLSAYRELDR
jgi:hypothetical protein